MSDARALLRQQRAARRIQHPHVQYSAPGKLSCTICHEPIKSEALWDSHTRSVAHRQRLLASAKEPRAPAVDADSAGALGEQKSKSSTDTLSDEALLAQIIGGTGHKRKHNENEEEDVEMDDATQEDESAPAKRSKPDLGSPTAPTSLSSLSSTAAANGSHPDNKDTERSKRTSTGGSTPPGLVRRISGTPSHGVKLQIPSRPATPSASATSTPKATPMGRSPLIPPEGQTAGLPSTTKPLTKAAFASSTGKDSATVTTALVPSKEEEEEGDDDDWAAFESEVVHAPPPAAPAKSTITAAASYSGDAVIAAAPMTAQQIAAKQEDEERERRRAQVDVDLEDEKEEATRALETEFEEMEELEARVRKLKEKREAIRRGSIPNAAATGPLDASDKPGVAADTGAANQPANGSAEVEEEDEDEDDEEDEDEDDWAGFRFRA